MTTVASAHPMKPATLGARYASAKQTPDRARSGVQQTWPGAARIPPAGGCGNAGTGVAGNAGTAALVAMGDKQAAEARDVDVPARHREHRQPGRPHAVLVRLSEEERRLIVAAARDARLTPTGFTAMAAVAVAGSAAGPAGGGACHFEDLHLEVFARP